jgi:hypothetical protein
MGNKIICRACPWLLCALLLVPTGTALAGGAGGSPSSTLPDPLADMPAMETEIVVEGRRVDEGQVKGFVDGALADAGRMEQIPRWHRPLCVSPRGFFPDQAEKLSARIQAAAQLAGLGEPKPGCKPNVAILLTDDPDALITRMLKDYPAIFTPEKPSAVRKALSRPRDASGAVRVWYRVGQFSADGEKLDVTRVGSYSITEAKRPSATRLSTMTRLELGRVIIVLDHRKLPGHGLDAVGDHLAMLSLGPFDSDVATGLPTILNLFLPAADANRPDALTDWDRSLLQELYLAPADAAAGRQRRAIARRLATGGEE